MALHSPQRIPLSLFSLSELESAQNLAGSCLTLCNRLLTSHSDSLLLPGDSIAASTGCLPFLGLPFLGLPYFLFSSVFSFFFFFFSFSSSLSFFFLCLSSSLCFFYLSLSLFSSRFSLRFFFSSLAFFSCLFFLFFSFIISTYAFSVSTHASFILLHLGLFKVSSSREEKMSARYEGTSPAATK